MNNWNLKKPPDSWSEEENIFALSLMEKVERFYSVLRQKGKLIGQEVADVTKRCIAEAINRLEPTATVQVSYIPIQIAIKR